MAETTTTTTTTETKEETKKLTPKQIFAIRMVVRLDSVEIFLA